MLIKKLLEKARVVRSAIVGEKKVVKSEQQRVDEYEANDRNREVQKYLQEVGMDDLERRHPSLLFQLRRR